MGHLAPDGDRASQPPRAQRHPRLSGRRTNLVTMAMNGWADGEPAWWLNLQAHPNARADLVDGPRAVTAHAAAGAERARLSGQGRELEPTLDGYAALRSSETAVVILEPGTDATLPDDRRVPHPRAVVCARNEAHAQGNRRVDRGSTPSAAPRLVPRSRLATPGRFASALIGVSVGGSAEAEGSQVGSGSVGGVAVGSGAAARVTGGAGEDRILIGQHTSGAHDLLAEFQPQLSDCSSEHQVRPSPFAS